MEIHIRVKRRHLVVLAVLAAAVVGGVAYASIPDSGGVYTACKLNATGTIRLIDPSLGSSSLLGHCTSLESKLTWNRTGQDGVSPTVAQLAAGDSHCPAGGASITDASGTTAFVCNGRSFSGSFQSPNGQYALQVSDQGVALSGPGAGLSITGGELGLLANDETVTVASARTESVGGNESVTIGGDRTTAIGRDSSTQIGRDQSVEIGANRAESIAKDETISVAGDRGDTVGGNDTLAVGKQRSESVAGDETVHVDGSKTEKDGANYQHEAGNDFTLKSGGNGTIESNGSLTLKAAVINQN